ncbi:MAG: hypothetical protein HQL15_05050 [Candidatus Omnitrophica bacterium]|nr:hypothetical protein [Candidatus Omnitrophota bacterium]
MNLQKMSSQKSVFETVKHVNQEGYEFWSARDFHDVEKHFLQVEKMVKIGSQVERFSKGFQI